MIDNGTANITWTVSFTPPTAANVTKPFPAIIALDGLFVPQPPEVAVLTFIIDDLAQQVDTTSRGQGLFYELYGTDATASAQAPVSFAPVVWNWLVGWPGQG